MSVNSVNKNPMSSYIPNFNTIPATPPAAQNTVEDKQKSNAYKYMIGATALAGLAALAVAGYKGHLGEGIQKLLGGVEKEAGSVKPKTPSSTVTPAKTESVVTENIEPQRIIQEAEEANPIHPIQNIEEEAGSIVTKPLETAEEEAGAIVKNQTAEQELTPIVEKETAEPAVQKQIEAAKEEAGNAAKKQAEIIEEEAGEGASENAAKVEKAGEIIAAKLEDVIPKEMLGYLKMTEAEIEKLDRISECSQERVISRYSNGKPKYTIRKNKDLGNIIKMYDEETGNQIKYLRSEHYQEYDPKIGSRVLKNIGIKDGKINYCSSDIKWDSENKVLESLHYEEDCKTPKYLTEYIYDPETKIKVKEIAYNGPDKSSGVCWTHNYDRITGKWLGRE